MDTILTRIYSAASALNNVNYAQMVQIPPVKCVQMASGDFQKPCNVSLTVHLPLNRTLNCGSVLKNLINQFVSYTMTNQ